MITTDKPTTTITFTSISTTTFAAAATTTTTIVHLDVVYTNRLLKFTVLHIDISKVTIIGNYQKY